jgi:hypothetical protein
MPASSYADLVRVMLALPGSAAEVAERVNMTQRGTTILLRRLASLKLVHIGAIRPTGPRAHPVAVWHEGEGTDNLLTRVGPPMRPRAQHIAFASVWRALQDGATVRQVVEETGVAQVSVYRILWALGSRAKIGGWEKDAQGRAVKAWCVSVPTNAPRPAKLTPGQKWDRYHQRVAFRTMAALGATASE